MNETEMLLLHVHNDMFSPSAVGAVFVYSGRLVEAKKAACDLWLSFQEMQPDSDSAFVGYLLEQRPELFLQEADMPEIVLLGA